MGPLKSVARVYPETPRNQEKRSFAGVCDSVTTPRAPPDIQGNAFGPRLGASDCSRAVTELSGFQKKSRFLMKTRFPHTEFRFVSKMQTTVKPRAKLTQSDAVAIFRLKASAASATSVARLYGVSEKAIRDIWKARTWAHHTCNLDTTRSHQIKHEEQPASLQNMPRIKSSNSKDGAVMSENDELKVQFSLGDCREAEASPFMPSKIQSCSKDDFLSQKFGATLNDQLFFWEQDWRPDPLWIDPFSTDWSFSSSTSALLEVDRLAFCL